MTDDKYFFSMVGLLISIFLLIVFLVSCSDPSDPQTSGQMGLTQYVIVKTPDGDVPCITWKYGYAGGLDCNWPAG